ncbi:GTPase-activating protein [Malassezia yamatoensis]|uniref:GTPase-activating protein n=1 Tax=Malassezia yamatoensis TaxID=253288 RepID=A0AAJ6CIU7_9BASI|nr:GTPase-activating protein [Malassezia yamatoensis]
MLGMTLSIDIATDIYPIHQGQQLTFQLVSSLRPEKGDGDEVQADRDAWRTESGDDLSADYDYVMYGKVCLACDTLIQIFKYDERSAEQVTVYGSFGGLLMALTGSYRHLSKVIVAHVTHHRVSALAMRRGSPKKPRRNDGWDDEAWASNSDDDEFVAKVVTRRTPSAAWARAMSTDSQQPSDAYQHLPQDIPIQRESQRDSPPASTAQHRKSAEISSKPDKQDGFLASLAESKLAMNSSDPSSSRPKLQAVVEGVLYDSHRYLTYTDPMALLANYRATLQEMYTPHEMDFMHDDQDANSTGDMVRLDDEAHDLGLQASYSAPSAPAFDPLATTGDGIMMTLGGFSPTHAERPPLRSYASERHAPPKSAPAMMGRASSTSSHAHKNLPRKVSTRTLRRYQQFAECLDSDEVNLADLRALAWNGIPEALRPIVWPLLLGYLPATASHRVATLERKRSEYAKGVERAMAQGIQNLDRAIWHQIRIDVPRTNPGIQLWQQETTQRALERLLYVWAVRHPASGYVQGINDLATPFFQVFLSGYIEEDPEQYDLSKLPQPAIQALEADTFWCLSKLLDGIQDNYIIAQPGIQRQLKRMGEVVARIDGTDSFSDFHPYVCAVFLHRWHDQLLMMDFQGMIMFLQSLPTQDWSDKDAELLLSEAFIRYLATQLI